MIQCQVEIEPLGIKFNMKWNTRAIRLPAMKINFACVCIYIVTLAAPASAWEVTRTKDRMTDKTVTWAAAKANGATLLVGCLNGRVSPRLTWPGRIGWGTIGVSYRVDDGPVIPRMAPLNDAGNVLYAWIAVGGSEVMRARRVRVQVGDEVYDFDLVKGEGLPKIQCQ